MIKMKRLLLIVFTLLDFSLVCICQSSNATDNQTTQGSPTTPSTFSTAGPSVSTTTSSSGTHDEEEREIEYSPYDGWYNNRANPDWGAIDSPLIRILPTAYSDGVYEPSGADRPNPLLISEQVFKGETGYGSYKNRTAFLVFFGQQVVEEVLDAQRPGCPPEYFNIKIPKTDERYNPTARDNIYMPFLRSRYAQKTGQSPNNPRQQLNEITPYIDGGLMYGVAKGWADALRLFKKGKLASVLDTDSPTGGYDKGEKMDFPSLNTFRLPMANPPPPADHYLKPVSRFFKLGNPRGNENPFLLTFGILWFRYHNHKAEEIWNKHPTWSDEKIFNEARKWTIATHQKIVAYDWLPAWLNEGLPAYKGYNPAVHPGISHVFQSAAMRFGHTLVPPGILKKKKVPTATLR